MATLLMPPDHHHQQQHQNHQNHQQQQQQQQRRSKKAKNGQKKQPQRGLGVAALEKIRMQEERKKVMLASSFAAPGSSPFQAQNLLQHHHHGVSALYQHQIHQAQAAAAFRNVNAPMIPAAMFKNDSPGSSNHNNYDLNLNLNLNLHQQQQQLLSDQEGMLCGSFSSSSDSGSCKSGISSDASLVLQNKQPQGRCSSSSPSPCSSQHNKSGSSHFDEVGDESSKAALALLASQAETSKNSNHHHHSLLNHQGHLIQPVSSSSNNNNMSSKECSPFGLIMPDSSDLFDPSFRIRSRDCREWPGVYSVPAIKELSSFQIPGNTNPAALSCANRIHAQASGTTITTGAATTASINNKTVRDGSSPADHGHAHIGVLAEPRRPSAKIVGSSSSSPSGGTGAGSSWGRSTEMGCFSFDATQQQQQVRDSCSSSLNNSSTIINNNSNNNRNLLALKLSSFENEEAVMNLKKKNNSNNNNNNRHLGFLNSSTNNSSSLSMDEAESSSKQQHQEASSASEDWGPRKSIKLHPLCSPAAAAATAANAFMLELSLKVPSTAAVDDASLELKLAL